MANFLRIKSSFERHVNRDLVTEARCHDSGDEFVVEYYFDNGNMASSRHATEAEAMAELKTFLRGPRPRPEPIAEELVKFVVGELQRKPDCTCDPCQLGCDCGAVNGETRSAAPATESS